MKFTQRGIWVWGVNIHMGEVGTPPLPPPGPLSFPALEQRGGGFSPKKFIGTEKMVNSNRTVYSPRFGLAGGSGSVSSPYVSSPYCRISQFWYVGFVHMIT